jgi:hypothetical protein
MAAAYIALDCCLLSSDSKACSCLQFFFLCSTSLTIRVRGVVAVVLLWWGVCVACVCLASCCCAMLLAGMPSMLQWWGCGRGHLKRMPVQCCCGCLLPAELASLGLYLRTWLQQVTPACTLVAALFAAFRVGIPAFRVCAAAAGVGHTCGPKKNLQPPHLLGDFPASSTACCQEWRVVLA